MKRSKHGLSYYKLLTCDMGKLVPCACLEVLPGDTIQQATSALIRVSPLVAPVMHPVSVRIHHWYVPHRLVWDGWEDFITGGADGLGGDSGPYPETVTGPGGYAKGSLMDYLGVPPGIEGITHGLLPVRSYNLIYNENYRDQDLSPERVEDERNSVATIAWEKDRYTAARPWPQKGPDVSLPLGVEAPVVTTGVPPKFTAGVATGTERNLAFGASGNQFLYTGAGVAGVPNAWFGTETGLKTDLTAASAVNVNDVRRAFALQRYQEARAMYGSRYTEYLRYLGVRSSDARLQRPEYLGGGKQTISFTEVLQTGPDTDDAGVASLKGHGIAAMRTRRYRRFFEEHGIVLSLLSVRPRTMYNDGIERMWSRRTKEDYWQKELEQIGQEEIPNSELWAQGTGTFGWGDRYDDYRHMRSKVCGDFRDTLNFWHLGRQFTAQPVLNQSFVECDPSKRIHAVSTNDVLWVMVSNSIQARRMVRRAGVGRIM